MPLLLVREMRESACMYISGIFIRNVFFFFFLRVSTDQIYDSHSLDAFGCVPGLYSSSPYRLSFHSWFRDIYIFMVHNQKNKTNSSSSSSVCEIEEEEPASSKRIVSI